MLIEIADEARFVRGRETVAVGNKRAQGVGVEARKSSRSASASRTSVATAGKGVATGQLIDAIRGEEEDRPLPKVWRNIPEEIQAGGISPVKISSRRGSDGQR